MAPCGRVTATPDPMAASDHSIAIADHLSRLPMATPDHLIAATNCSMATMNHPTAATVQLVTITHRHLIADDDYPMAAMATHG